MTEAEVIQLVGTAVMAYPKWQEMGPQQIKSLTTVWSKMLGDLSPMVAETALLKHIATSKFPPTVAEIREHAASLIPTDLPNAEDAWGEVLRVMKTTGYMRSPEWSHPVVGDTVKAMWGSWANACATLQTDTLGVDRAQFLRMYGTMTKRQREAALLPASVREMAGMIAAKMRLPALKAVGE